MPVAAENAKPNARAAAAEESAEAPRKRQRGGQGGGQSGADAAGAGDEPAQSEVEADARLAPGFVNEYAGFRVPAAGYEVERVAVDAVASAEQFFREYVAPRKPVVLSGFLRDAEFSAPAKWTDAYLSAAAGDEELAVERRAGPGGAFGRGERVRMPFRELLALLARGDELHYLTTQEVARAADGRPALMAPLVRRLRGDFPLRPALMGRLVPQNINVWMGGSRRAASSTGLHHDYHDNLYVVLRGRKRFRLYSPADAADMYTRGRMTRVHANGRVNYEGEDTTAYGADPRAEAEALAAIAKDAAERELAAAERARERGEPGAEQRLARAEEQLDAAMEAVLRADKDEEEDEGEEDGENGAFHFEDEEEEDEEEEDEEQELDELALDPEEAAAEKEAEAEAAEEESKPAGEQDGAEQPVTFPVSFSRVDPRRLATDAEALFRQFPRFRAATEAFCELGAGDMLFLPASWFHEVESLGSADGHLALNYWFHPPDQLESFETPYSSPLWPRDWAARVAAEAEQAAAQRV